jgi:hypothetical protein
MPKRSREEKLAAYSQGAKRGYRSRKAFVKANGLERKEPRPGKVEAPLIGDPGGIATGRALGKAGPGDAAQNTRLDNRKCNLDQNAQTVNRVMHLLS